MTAGVGPCLDLPEIRLADLHDLEDLVALERACFDRPWNRRVLADELELESSTTLLARHGEDAVGYAISRALILPAGEGSAELLRLGVRPGHRRRSLARELTRRLIASLRELGVAELELEVREDNTAARALYTGLGFEIVGERRGYYEDRANAVLMTLDLRTAADS